MSGPGATSDADIEALRDRAARAGDTITVGICANAIRFGSGRIGQIYRRQCAEIIRNESRARAIRDVVLHTVALEPERSVLAMLERSARVGDLLVARDGTSPRVVVQPGTFAGDDEIVIRIPEDRTHSSDLDCAPYLVGDECQVCGVGHGGQACATCGGRGYHRDDCAHVERGGS